MKRLGSTEEYANTALFFAVQRKPIYTGQTLIVDGGQTLVEIR